MAALGPSTLIATDLYSAGDALVAKCRISTQTHAQRLAYLVNANTSRPWRAPTVVQLPAATNVRLCGTMPEATSNALGVSCAITYDGVFGCALIRTGAGAATNVICHVFELGSGDTVAYFLVSTGATETWRVASLGATFALFRLAAAALSFYVLTPTATNPAVVSAPTTLIASAVTDFRAAVARETTPGAMHILTLEAGNALYRQFTTAGVIVGGSKTVATGAEDIAIASDDTQVFALTQSSAGHIVSLLSFSATSPYTTAVGPTALFSSHAFTGARLGVSYNTTNLFCAAEDQVTTAVSGASTTGRDTYIEVRTRAAHVLGYAPVHSQAQFTSNWVVKGECAAVGLYYTNATPGTSSAVNVGPNGYVDSGDANSSGPWWADDYTLAGGSTAPLHEVGQGPLATALMSHMVEAPGGVRRPVFRVMDVASTARRPGCELNDTLYVSGGSMVQFTPGPADGVENGMPGPVLRADSTDNVTGAMLPGTYAYRAITTWVDSQHRTHRSAVSSEIRVTTTGALSRVLMTWAIPKTLRHDSTGFSPPRLDVFRTEAGAGGPGTVGEVFRLVESAYLTAAQVDDLVSIEDRAADSTILTGEVLYTEGEAGAVSGALDITPATPHAYVAPLRDRLVVGTIDSGSGYQVSQITLPNEPVAFTQPAVSGTPALAYRDSVEGRVTAVAALDDTIVVATVDHIYLSSGDGPNLAGQGEFSSPARLPTDVGIFDWRSLLENSEGLYFLGSAAQMYLLPRGGGSPTRVQQPQTLWARGTVVGAGTDIQDDCSLWAIDTGSTGIAAVRDLSKQVWMRDGLPFRPIAFRAHQGVLYAIDTAGTVWQQSATAFGDNGSVTVLQVTTGDVLALSGGIGGFGRFGAIELLGEYRSDATLLVEASYDSGKTFVTLGGSAFTVSGLAVGEMWQRQWYPSQQRAGKVRLRVTMTPSAAAGEGSRLTGAALYMIQSTGPTRLGSTKRK